MKSKSEVFTASATRTNSEFSYTLSGYSLGSPAAWVALAEEFAPDVLDRIQGGEEVVVYEKWNGSEHSLVEYTGD